MMDSNPWPEGFTLPQYGPMRAIRSHRLYRSLNERHKRLFAIDCASRIVPVYEQDYPNDASAATLVTELYTYIRSFKSQQKMKEKGDAFYDLGRENNWEIIEVVSYWLEHDRGVSPAAIVDPLVQASETAQLTDWISSSGEAASGLLVIADWVICGPGVAAVDMGIYHSKLSADDEEVWHKPKILSYLAVQKRRNR